MQTASKLNNTKPAPLPPRASGLPILGSIPQIMRLQGSYFLEAQKKHGDIYLLNLGPISFVVLGHPDFAQHVLRDNARNYVKDGALYKAVRGMLGNGLVTSEGNYWRRQRRMLQPKFHRQYLAGITELISEGIEEIMQDWDKLAADGKAVDVSQLFPQITMNVIMKTMFGRSINPEEMNEVASAFNYSIPYLMQDTIVRDLPGWIPVPGRKQYHEALAKIDAFVYKMIKQHRINPDQSMDIVSMMLQMVDEETNEPMCDEEIRDEIVTIFVAGYETTSLAMAWGTYVLGQKTAIQSKLKTHIDAVLQGRSAKFEDLHKLDYVRMVISETLRLYSPAPLLSRMALEEDVIGGYRIPSGQTILVHVYLFITILFFGRILINSTQNASMQKLKKVVIL